MGLAGGIIPFPAMRPDLGEARRPVVTRTQDRVHQQPTILQHPVPSQPEPASQAVVPSRRVLFSHRRPLRNPLALNRTQQPRQPDTLIIGAAPDQRGIVDTEVVPASLSRGQTNTPSNLDLGRIIGYQDRSQHRSSLQIENPLKSSLFSQIDSSLVNDSSLSNPNFDRKNSPLVANGLKYQSRAQLLRSDLSYSGIPVDRS